MLLATLSSFSGILSNYLRLSFALNDDIVVLSSLNDHEKSTKPNKMVVSLINVERETVTGSKFGYSSVTSSEYKKTRPSWQLNLYVLVAAVFTEKQYKEGLQLLSGSLLFMQNNNTMTLPGTDITISLEPVNLSFSELSNLWSICGSTYYPSIVCKIRAINLDSNEINKIVSAVKKEDVQI